MTFRSRTRLSSCIGTLCLFLFTGAAASAVTTAPERAVREFIRALAMHDTQAFSRAIRPDPRASRFINPQPLTPEGQAEAARRLETLQVRRSDDVLLRGKPVDADAQGDYPVGSVGHFIASGNGGPAVVTLVRDPDGWKVDLRWWLAMLDMANGRPPTEGSPDHAIRSLTLALIALDRDEALRFVAPGTDISVLFAGAPSVREPSGVLEASRHGDAARRGWLRRVLPPAIRARHRGLHGCRSKGRRRAIRTCRDAVPAATGQWWMARRGGACHFALINCGR